MTIKDISAAFILFELIAFPTRGLADSFDDSFIAAKLNDPASLATLLARGIPADLTDANGDTLLMTAVREGSTAVVYRLLQAGATVDKRNTLGETALMLAALHGNKDCVIALLAHKASVNFGHGWTPLMYAAFKGHLEIVRLLASQGAMLDSVSPNGTSALMLAAMEGHLEVVKWLLSHGANSSLTNSLGKTAVDLALGRGNTDIAELINLAKQNRP